MIFDELRSAVHSSMARDDIPAHVYALTTAEINARFRISQMDAIAVLTTVEGMPYLALPTGVATTESASVAPRCLAIKHAFIGADGSTMTQGGFSDGFSDGFELEVAQTAGVIRPLEATGNWGVSSAWTRPGTPGVYTQVGRQIRLGPVPNGAHTIVLHYIGAMPALALDTDTNPILEEFPSLYLYQALRHAAIWAQDFELAQAHMSVYETEAERVIKADRVGKHAGPLVIRRG